MILKPDEFYDLNISDWTHVINGFNKRMRKIEEWHRRSAFIVGAASYQGKDNFVQWFSNSWPLPGEMQESIDDKVKRLRAQGQRDAKWLTEHADAIRIAVERARREKADKEKAKRNNASRRFENSGRG